MIKQRKVYDCLGDKYNYTFYCIKTKKDKEEVYQLFLEEQKILRNDKISTKKWSKHKVYIWGIVQSLKGFMDIDVTSASEDEPFNVYEYNI